MTGANQPTNEIVAQAVARFDQENAVVEGALDLVFKAYPLNSNPQHVLIKTTLLNRLYSAGILDVSGAAQHIVQLGIDAELEARSPAVVEKIAKMRLGGKERNHYSFATKYCSWHRPDVYPIYDSLVDRCLMVFRRQDAHFTFKQNDLYRYESFVRIVDDLRQHYDLRCSYKDLDKFLWIEGQGIAKAKAAKA